MANSMSGLSEQEAQEFHKYYMQGFFLFVAVAVVAHILVWAWRPWLQGTSMASVSDGLHTAALTLTSVIG
ncbi:MAG: light-harvesting antenna LH1, beta subunit [Alphaproteobacteria bacterium]|nr:light-harvesting antenna LH1, beta subunit [Alphaproteobacteria bacterium]